MFKTTKKNRAWDGSEDLTVFIDLCRFDIFMKSCQIDYVGEENVSRESFVREVCNNITKLKQTWKDENGKETIDTPEDLFLKFLRFGSSLPDDTSTWTMQLPSAFLTALNDKIKKKIVTSSFVMPNPSLLRTKQDQINATRLIKSEASRIYEEFEERAAEIKEELSLLTRSIPRQHKTTVGFSHGQAQPMFVGSTYSSTSLAEETIQKYKGIPSNVEHEDIELRTVKGITYPFHKPRQFLSDYPIGFRGCYVCGSQDHWKKDDCALVRSGNFDRQRFFKNLWAHRPHTFTHKPATRSTPSGQSYVAQSGMYPSLSSP